MRLTILILVFGISLYFGYGSIKAIQILDLYEKLKDPSSKESKDTVQVVDKYGKKATNQYYLDEIENSSWLKKYYPFYREKSKLFYYLIGTFCCGLVGTIIFLLITILFQNKNPTINNTIGFLFLGGLLGALIFGILKFMPMIFYQEPSELVPGSCYIMSALGGMFSEEFYKKILKFIQS